MQKRYRLPLQALLLAACLVVGMSAALYAADEEEATIEPGLVIVAVDPAGPAAKAGVARGDILLAIDDVKISSVADLLTALAKVEAGATVTLQVQHGDETVAVEIKTGDQQQRAYLGIRPYGGMDLLMTPPEQFAMPALPPMVEPAPSAAFPPTAGAVVNQLVVVDVLKESGAAEAGIQVNDVITAVNGEAGLTLPALQAQLTTLAPGDVVTLTVVRPDAEPTDVAVTLGEGPAGQAQIGVQLGMVSLFDAAHGIEQPPAFMPVPPMMTRPFPFPQEGPWQQGRRFFPFDRPFAPQMYFFVMPYPGWSAPAYLSYEAMPYPGWAPQDFLKYEEGFVMSAPAQPEQWFAAPPVSVEIQGEIQQGTPAEQAPEAYY